MGYMAVIEIKRGPVFLFRLAVLSLALGAACSGQTVQAVAGDPDVVAASSRLSNISTRAVVQSDNDALIGGFIIGGTGSKQVLLRALGPTLAQFGVAGALLDPTLELRDSSGGVVISNDNWEAAANAQSIPANLRPPNAQESAILATLNPGSYTAIVRGVNNTTGVALVEAYDLDTSATSELTNISTRGLVQTNSNVMIAGVVVQTRSENVIVRALGPTLANFGVTNPLVDPALELRDANGSLLASNDNWKTAQQTEITASSYAPPNDLEPAVVTTLAPGNYTAIVRGVNSATGIALVEVYALPTPEVWIAVRTDGLPGSGTQADPYDGSTPEKFDALMMSYYWTYNLRVNLMGPGPFRTYANHRWAVRPGWVLSGDGMYSTTLQMVGSVAGIHYTVNCISSDSNVSSDYITIQDLTVDCNWAELSRTADNGAGGEKNIATSGIVLFGSNNLVQRVRAINCYGSWANLKESFGISLTAPVSSDGTNNVIQFCRAELPQGNMQDAFALTGWVNSTPYHLITDSKVLSSTCVGVNNGTVDAGFTSAGVNLGNVKNCVVDGNSFTDCYGTAYNDTGSLDGVQITNNTVIRGWEGVGLRTSLGPTLPKQNILIRGNNINIQNRVPGGGSYGIVLDQQVTTNLTIDHNTITFDGSGVGGDQSFFFGMYLYLLNTATISNNTIGLSNFQYYNTASGSGLIMFNNLWSDGTLIPALNNQ
jgi:hypothetical protein